MIDTETLVDRARRAGVVPVLTIADEAHAVPLARALVAGGLDVLEVTLRTGAARGAITAIAGSGLDCVIGAGTILSAADVEAAEGAGAQFLVTPGTPASLVPALQAFAGPVIPGASTASEAMTLAGHGFNVIKFFPAEPAGGAAFLKALAGPLPRLRVMPTGGIRPASMAAYLALESVIAVGGSWLAPEDALAAGDWGRIEALAREASQAARQAR